MKAHPPVRSGSTVFLQAAAPNSYVRLFHWLIAFMWIFSGAAASAQLTITRTSSTNIFYIDTSRAPHLNSAYTSYVISNNTGIDYENVWARIDSFTGGSIGLAANENGEANLGRLTNGASKAVFFYLSATGAVASAQSHLISVFNGYPSFGGMLLASNTYSFRGVQETIAANANKVNIVVYGPEPPTLGGIMTIEVDGNSGTIGSSKIMSFSPATYAHWRADAYEMTESVITFDGGNSGSFTNQLLIPTTASWSTHDTHYKAVYKFRAVGVTEAPTSVSPVGFISSGTQMKHTGTGNFGSLPPIQPATNTTTMMLLADTNQLFGAGVITYTLRFNNSGTNNAYLDRLVDTLPAGATYLTSSSSFNGALYDEPFVNGQTLTWVGYFEIPAGDTRDFVFQVSYPGATGSHTNTAAGYTQDAQIDTTLDTTDNKPGTHILNIYVGPNIAPVANDDFTTTQEDVPVAFDVTANDSDGNGNLDPGTVDLDTVLAGRQNSITNAAGVWSVTNGIVTYTPTADFIGNAALVYSIDDTAGLTSGNATLAVEVTEVTDAPTLSVIGDITINEDDGLQTVNLTGIGIGGGSILTITATSSAPGIIPHPTVNYTSPNATGSLSFAPVPNAYGDVTITVVAEHDGDTAGGGSNAVVRTFTVTVNPVNDVPGFTKGPNINLNKDATNAVTFASWASNITPGPANETNQLVTFLVSTTNSAFFAAGGQPTINSQGTLAFTLAGVVGTNTITVQLKDNGGTANGGTDTTALQTFVIRSSSAGLIPASGGSSISATSAAPSTAWTTLIGPKYIEGDATNVTTGTIVLHPPAGFEFDTNTLAGPAPTVLVHTVFTNGTFADSRNINALPHGSAITVATETNKLTITITQSSQRSGANIQYCSLTWTNVRVRPLLGQPLASGFMTNSGSSTLAQVTPGNTSWGPLAMVAGPAAALQIFAQPSPQAQAGQPFQQQPIIRLVDSAGNWLYNDNTTQVTVSRFNGAGSLQGTTTLTAVGGEVRYTDLFHNVAGTINLQFNASGLPPVVSDNIVVAAGAPSVLAIQTQPSPVAMAGVAFAQQPVIRIEDAFGNLIQTNVTVTVTRNSGLGTLQGLTTVTAVNGIASFSGLHHLVAGTIDLQFTSPGLNSATSSNIVVSTAPASKLTISTQPSSTAIAGQAFAQQPVIRIEDAYGNLITTDNTTQITVVRDVGDGTLQGVTTLTANGGIVSYANLSHLVASVINLTFTSDTGLTPVTSANITIQPGDPAGLAIEAQPSARATLNIIFPDQPVLLIVDAYGNWVPTASTNEVNVTRDFGSGELQGTTNITVIDGVAVFTNLYHGTLGTIDLLFTAEGLNSVTSRDIIITPEITQLLFTTQPQDAAAGTTIGGGSGVVVQLADSNGDPVAAADVDINVSLFTGSGILYGTLTIPTDAAGKATYQNLYMTAPGVKSMEAVSETLTVVSDDFVITAGAPANIVFLTQPGDAIVGQTVGDVTVLVTDAYGNPVTGASVTITLNTGSGSVSGTTTLITDASGLITFTDLAVTQSGTKTLLATSGSASGTSDPFDVISNDPTQVAFVQQPADATAGETIVPAVGVQLKDSFGNNVSQAGVSITLALTTGAGTLSGTASQPTDASGLALFADLSINLIGTKNLTASSSGLASAESSDFVISSGAPSKVVFLQQPSDTVAGELISPAVTVQLQDAFGNPVSTAGVTVSLALTDGTGSLEGTLSVTTDTNGIAAFNDLTLEIAGPKELTASSVGLTSEVSDPFLITSAAAAGLAIDMQPSAVATAGEVFAQQPVVRLVDLFGNTVSSDNTTEITVARNGGSGTLQGTKTVTVSDGLATFTNLFHTVSGTIDLVFTSSPDVGVVVSDQIVISAAAANRLAIVTQPSATALEGVAFAIQPVVRIEDEFGNPVAGDNTTQVTVGLVSGDGTLEGTATVTVVNGVATFSGLYFTAGGTINLEFTSSPALTPVTSNDIVVTGVNDAPVFTLTTANVQTVEDSGPQTFEIASLIDAGALDESWQTLTIAVTNDEPSLFLEQPQITTAGMLSYTLNPDVSGVAQVTVTVMDNGGTANGGVDTTVVNFIITALPVNDPPTFIKSQDVLLPTTTRTANLTNFMHTMLAGPPDESGQSMAYSVTNDSPWAFVVQPVIDVNGALTFEIDTMVSNLLATVTVVLQDDGGTENGGVDTSITQTFRIALSTYHNYPRGSTFTNLSGPAGMWLGNLRGTAQWRDIITANYSNNTVSVRLWRSASVFSPATNYPVGPQPVAVRAVNLDNDPYEDIVCANYGTNTISVLLNLRNGSFGEAEEVTVGMTANPGPMAITQADANNDGYMDIFTANHLENTVSVLFGAGYGLFSAMTNCAVGAGPSSIHVTDMNNDGHVDILTANQTAGTLTVLHGRGDGSFTPGQTITLFSGGDPQPIYALPADLNGDGAQDIVTANYSSNTVSILLQQTDKSFAVFTNYIVGRNPRSLLVRDLNHDGHRDIAVVNYGDSSLQVLISRGDGSFEYGDILATGLNPTIVVGSNFNDDMTTDFVVSNFGDGTLSLFRYTGPITYNQSLEINEDVPRTFALKGVVTSYLGSTTNYVILAQPTNGVVSLVGSGPNVTYTPDQDYFGQDTFTYRAEYMVGDVLLKSGTSTVSITIRPLNDQPTFTLASAVVTVPEESLLITMPNFAGNIMVGPENESDQTGAFTVAASSATAFSVKPAIDPSGTLTFQPALNFVGTVNVTVRLRDSGSIGIGHTNLSSPVVFQIVVTPLRVKQLKGVYNGLFHENTAISHHSSGYFTFTMASTRNFTGKLMLDGQTLLFSNRFDNAGEATTMIPRISRPPITLGLALDLATSSDQVTGTVSSDGWAAYLLGDRRVFNAITNRAPLAGKYTLVLPGTTDDPTTPAGDGYGILTISTAGLLKFSGALSDGTAVGQGTSVSKNGYWPLYLSRYSGKGSLLGWVHFTNRTTSSFEGDINWIKPTNRARLYPAGFTNEVRMLGSSYIVPTNSLRFVNLTNAQLTLTGGNLLYGLTNDATLSVSNLFSFTGTNQIALTVKPLSGFVSGSFTNPVTRKRVTVRGVGLQQQEVIRGFFLGTNQSGVIRIENK